MKKGIWKKYDKCTERHSLKKSSYDQLYEDLKDSNKDWCIANDYEWCKDHICGELVPCYNIEPGDIYVYYEIENNLLNPVFYFKIEEHMDYDTKKAKNYIEVNGSSVVCADIDEKYIPTLIEKLTEIDKSKNQHYINVLTKKYNEYTKLIQLLEKEVLDEDDILFLYYMACTQKHEKAISKIKERDIVSDYNYLSIDNKIKLFLEIQNDKICDSLLISDKNILKLIAENKSLRFFKNTTADIIHDKEFVKELLMIFFNSDKKIIYEQQLTRYLPEIYKRDLDMLEFIFYNYTTSFTLTLAKWLEKSNDIESLRKNKQFVCRLIDSFSRSLILRNQSYYNNCILWFFDDDAINNMDTHVLIGPEPTEEKEILKELSIITLRKNIKESINYGK